MAAKHDTEGRGGPWVWCLDLYQSASVVSRFTSHNQAEILDGNTYAAQEMALDLGTADASGTLQSWSVTLQNVDRALSTLCNAGAFKNFPAIARYVQTGSLAVSKAARTRRGTIKETTYDTPTCLFVCGSNDLRQCQSPGNKCNRLICRWLAFKDFECKYAGVATSCVRTYEACEALGNLANFGGFPGIPLEHL